jgi:hypothetical protein
MLQTCVQTQQTTFSCFQAENKGELYTACFPFLFLGEFSVMLGKDYSPLI